MKNIITIERQKELITINRVLALLVVFFTFSSGFLLALREEWFTAQTKVLATPLPQVALPVNQDAIQIKLKNNTPYFQLLKQAQYEHIIVPNGLNKDTLTQLVWAAQGKITNWGERTVPSYKSKYPLSLFVLVRQVEGVSPGIYLYNPLSESLEPTKLPFPNLFSEASQGLKNAPMVIGVSTLNSLKDEVLVWNEAGGVAQNILLAAKEASLVTYLIPGEILSEGEAQQYVKPTDSLLWLMPLSTIKQTTQNNYRK